MAGHDASVNIRVSLLTAQILEYWGVCHAKLARSKARKAAVPLAYVPQVSGALQIIEPRTLSRPQAPASRKSSLQSIQSNLHDKAAATCLVQNVSVLSQSHDVPQWRPDQTPDWALGGEDSPRCSFESHQSVTSQVDFSIEKPKDYINLSDLMDSATMLVGFGSRDVGSSSNSSSSRRGSSVSTPSRASSIREVESSAGRR
ncbi:uncharacterized protein SEPMUDRAFT_148249 [Sphaerulina musiva SO2202]|uniref:Uncharacterized protein n=1 Tax=Sphaerulina musiva (strain SO2202) TaxID=692275 RepID=M3D8W1_SPHMS|nr:uncharacterized protein SEPMUDRAFT_148249 [Sphaerulina musiva SO2202]EMF14580.1 hypothetical protein SEPMUDRAFT_148249 [Sphaerulina musiva SO2202]